MNTEKQRKRNRIIALAFASVLLVVIYGPLSQWFVAADRVLYDQLAGGMPNKALDNTYIATIDANKLTHDELLQKYGQVIQALQNSGVQRIILPNPPAMSETDNLPAWTALLTAPNRVHVPTRHRLADVAAYNGFVALRADMTMYCDNQNSGN